MNLLANNDGLECLFQFGMVAFFLLMSFGGWVIKQITGASNRAAMEKRRRAEQQMRDFQPQPQEQQVQSSPRPKSNPYESYAGGYAHDPYANDDDVLEADVVQVETEHHLGEKLSASHLGEHASHLGKIDSYDTGSVHDQFDDQLGRLGDSSDAIHEDPDAEKLPEIAVTTSEIADVFRNPGRIREAIILNEILTRPVED